MASGITSHERPNEGATNDWLTPRHVLNALGPFDLDVCASVSDPTRCAPRGWTVADDGLQKPWEGFVWCNPPYGPHVGIWLDRMALHNNGIALVFARTETRAVNSHLQYATSVLFHKGRLCFERPYESASGNAGAPSMFLAYGTEADARLRASALPGIVMKVAVR